MRTANFMNQTYLSDMQTHLNAAQAIINKLPNLGPDATEFATKLYKNHLTQATKAAMSALEWRQLNV